MDVLKERINVIKTSQKNTSGPVVYWMHRDQRVEDNWALIRALQISSGLNTHVEVLFCIRNNLKPHFGTRRMLDFMMGGLKEVHANLSDLNIPFKILVGDPGGDISSYISEPQAAALVTDLSPLKTPRRWLKEIVGSVDCTVEQVDAHNIVPVWVASPKQEWAAYTFRPKVLKLLPKYLTQFPKLTKQIYKEELPKWVVPDIDVDEQVILPKNWLPGSIEAHVKLTKFINNQADYSNHRNDPTKDVLSNLSPYLHFGQISAQRVALSVKNETFLEELVVRRELAENYCWYNSNYSNPEGFPSWAKDTLKKHSKDTRENLYTLSQLEKAKTQDPAWNAAQKQMVSTGKMHGYMRMYWAKKILDWTPDVKTAQEYAIYLNDKYELDGRDPNGYTGIAWSLGGVHDRPWFDRPVIGTVRPMVASGLKRKFAIDEYISKYEN